MADVYEMTTLRGDYTQPLPVKAGEIIEAGAFFGVTAAGLAVPADDATAVRMGGRATTEADNSAAGASNGDVEVLGERKTYVCANSGTDPVDEADVLKPVYLESQNVVRASQEATEPVAGLLLGFDASGDPVVDVSAAPALQAAADALTAALAADA